MSTILKKALPLSSPSSVVNAHVLEQIILPQVFKPGRYLGFEQGAYRKPFEQASVRMAFAFPDLYEIGISNYGIKLLYSLVNQQPRFLCDRVYAPALDFKAKLAEYDMPLYGLESRQPLKAFDLLAFSLQYELNYTTIFGILEAAQIPFRAAERRTSDTPWPLLIAGGPGSANPMPLAPFFDAFIIGDGEQVLLEILEMLEAGKQHEWPVAEKLARLAQLPGVFVPGLSTKADKRIVDIAEDPVQLAPLIPFVEAVHDRVVVEARRGCDRMCRFCQPCFINLPVREQSIETMTRSALEGLDQTGYEECSLLSLSIADYSDLKPLVREVSAALKTRNASLSLPSQRADRFSLEVAEAVQGIRKSTLTFAPEAGTARLRDVVNKNLSDAEILNAVTTAYQAGWNKVKLYFMIGLPTETQDDLDGIVDLVWRLKQACESLSRQEETAAEDAKKRHAKKRHLDVNLTLSNFVPKPHTPFQWFAQDSIEMLKEKIAYLKQAFGGMRGIKLNFTDPELSKLEAVLARGDESLADVLEAAYAKGAYLDAWDDVNNFAKWFQALSEAGLDAEVLTREMYTHPENPLPWDCIDMGLDKAWLQEEFEKAKAADSTTPCFEACSTCGVCGAYSTWPKFYEPDEQQPAQQAINTVRPPVRPLTELKKDPVQTVRLTIQKTGPLRFISHLDWLRLLHRAIARARLPVAYSQGFNPSPRVSFGPPLPLFMQGLEERVDIDLVERLHHEKDAQGVSVMAVLNPFLPEGGKIMAETWLPPHSPSIEKQLRTATYRAHYHVNREIDLAATCQSGDLHDTIHKRLHLLVTDHAMINSSNSSIDSSEPVSEELASESLWTVTVETKKARQSFNLRRAVSDLRLVDPQTVEFTVLVNSCPDLPTYIKPDWVLRLLENQPEQAPEGTPVIQAGLAKRPTNTRWAVTRTALGLSDKSPSLP